MPLFTCVRPTVFPWTWFQKLPAFKFLNEHHKSYGDLLCQKTLVITFVSTFWKEANGLPFEYATAAGSAVRHLRLRGVRHIYWGNIPKDMSSLGEDTARTLNWMLLYANGPSISAKSQKFNAMSVKMFRFEINVACSFSWNSFIHPCTHPFKFYHFIKPSIT